MTAPPPKGSSDNAARASQKGHRNTRIYLTVLLAISTLWKGRPPIQAPQSIAYTQNRGIVSVNGPHSNSSGEWVLREELARREWLEPADVDALINMGSITPHPVDVEAHTVSPGFASDYKIKWRYFTVAEVAAHKGVTEEEVLAWIAAGKITPAPRKGAAGQWKVRQFYRVE